MRVQRMKRSASPAWLMRDARGAAPGQDANSIAGAERLVGLLHDRQVIAGIEEYRHFDAPALVGGLLDVLPDDAAQDRPADGAGDLAVAAAHGAAGEPAQHRAARGADAAVARADAHVAHRLDDAEAHRLLAAHFVALVVTAARVVGAPA